MNFRPTFRRMIALAASFILLPEALLFLGLSIWKGNRFVKSLSEPGPPFWYSLSSSIFLLTASFFCFFTCRDLWRNSRAKPEKDDRSELSTEQERNSVAAHRLTMLWLSAALTMCMFVLPLLLVTLGALLDQREEVSWLIGVPVGLGVLVYFSMLVLRKRKTLK